MLEPLYGIHRAQADRHFPAIQTRNRAPSQRAPQGAQSCLRHLNESSRKTARDLNEILDISEEGMSIQTSSPLEVDRDLNLCLDLSETRTRIRTSGQVVWSDDFGTGRNPFSETCGRSLEPAQGMAFCECAHRVRSCPLVDGARDGYRHGPRCFQRLAICRITCGRDELHISELRNFWQTDRKFGRGEQRMQNESGVGTVRSRGRAAVDCGAGTDIHSRHRGGDRLVRGRCR